MVQVTPHGIKSQLWKRNIFQQLNPRPRHPLIPHPLVGHNASSYLWNYSSLYSLNSCTCIFWKSKNQKYGTVAIVLVNIKKHIFTLLSINISSLVITVSVVINFQLIQHPLIYQPCLQCFPLIKTHILNCTFSLVCWFLDDTMKHFTIIYHNFLY